MVPKMHVAAYNYVKAMKNVISSVTCVDLLQSPHIPNQVELTGQAGHFKGDQ